ncbi:hypothetical protein BC939DRAFT_462059 [Gamsiella multidivaricata]|uniref:uncharacterized protein n=1 Tax=Gamsiella multidivaricata TaxID=101098 RepID=UPI00221F6482|nr:uncharacterized protein BC939DRAFT_462059 [Gamsiella multidivaricata]KAI7818811.1 hypothetical protein BC939DRAFT_462059 [Gamsiella multidivaricata]
MGCITSFMFLSIVSLTLAGIIFRGHSCVPIQVPAFDLPRCPLTGLFLIFVCANRYIPLVQMCHSVAVITNNGCCRPHL